MDGGLIVMTIRLPRQKNGASPAESLYVCFRGLHSVLDVSAEPKNDSGGAGGVSTAVDYLRFGQMLLNGGELDGVRTLSRSTIKLMTSDQLGTRIVAPFQPGELRDLVGLCDRRKHSSWLSYEVGAATTLRYPDASFDVLVCTQVAEYIPDIDVLLSEAFRVLRPNGRTIFIATDWDALVWFSEDAKRMAAVLRSWEAHCAHPRLPRTMPHRLTNAGFRLDSAFVYSLLNLSYDEDSYSKGLSTIIKKFVRERGDVSASDLDGWLNEFDRLNEAGRYFFSSNGTSSRL